MKISFKLFLFALVVLGCKQEKHFKNNKKTKAKKVSTIKHATGFDIIKKDNQLELLIKKPYPDAQEEYRYVINGEKDDKNSLQTPVKKIVVSSTTHIPMLELLGVEESLIGFQNLQYVSSPKTRALIDAGKIKELGKEEALNTEILLELKPDLVVGFTITKTNKIYNLIESNGIPVVINGDWLEETPLGRAEWIKFFGLLFNKQKEADSIFKQIEQDYLQAKNIASTSMQKPSVISGIVYQGIWHSPGGKSFMAHFFNDANMNYLWSNTEKTGSIPLSIESVFEKGSAADIWIGCGLFTHKKDLKNANGLYSKFKAFSSNKIFTNALKTGDTGGILFYEIAPTRPDLVLKDMIKIAHPTLLINYELSFFNQLQ